LALSYWGVALYEQAQTKTGEEADRLFEEAGRRYADALRLKPDDHEVLNNWGVTLSARAKTKSGEEADHLFEEACRKFAEALDLKPDLHQALSHWGDVLSEQAKTRPCEDANYLLQQARQKLLDADRIRPGSAAYSLACVEAKMENVGEAVRWLRTFQTGGSPLSRAKLAADMGFERIRNRPEFIAYAESLPET
jgi:cytochrome c-type biogenesis protein CcmH/NrfG